MKHIIVSDPLYSRSVFLRMSVRIFSIFALGLQFRCQSRETPQLRGISSQEYHNMHAVGEIFLKDSPLKNFDIGLALDNYIYGHPYPLDTQDQIHELALLPSSLLASLALDFSFQPLVKLGPKEREKRLLSWRDSESKLKRGLYNLLQSTCFFLVGGSREFLLYTGYLHGK